LNQLAKTRRAVFVEGKDFQILSAFARCLKRYRAANRSDFAVIPVDGSNPQKVKDFSQGIELAVGGKVDKGVIFDRDYRSAEEVEELLVDLRRICSLAHIHKRKEIENYLLVPSAIERTLHARIREEVSIGDRRSISRLDV
jgi:hypothetical protein